MKWFLDTRSTNRSNARCAILERTITKRQGLEGGSAATSVCEPKASEEVRNMINHTMEWRSRKRMELRVWSWTIKPG